MLAAGANVNIYMFFGGTNFGFTAGANDWGTGKYMADITSYDYDAIMDESGDPTKKYHLIRDVIKKYINVSLDHPTPSVSAKMVLPSIPLVVVGELLSSKGRQYLGRDDDANISKPIKSVHPLTFEQLNQYSGLVLYETLLPTITIDPSVLTVGDLRDRAVVFIDNKLVGILSRENAITKLPIQAGVGNILQILVENQGRINFNNTNDIKVCKFC